MGKHLAKIQAGLQHFKQLMTRSKPPLVIRRLSSNPTMFNPLGNHNMMPPPRPAPRAPHMQPANNGQHNPNQNNVGFYANPAPPPQNASTGPSSLNNNNRQSGFYANPGPNQNPANSSVGFYGSMPPLQNPHLPVNPPSSTGFYNAIATQSALNQAPPPQMLPSLMDTNNNNAATQHVAETQSDQQLNQSLEGEITDWSNVALLDEFGPLKVEEDLKLYENFLEIERIRTSDPQSTNQLKNLTNGEYVLEATTQWHKSAHLMTLLVMYYRKHFYEKNSPFTFSEIVTRLTPTDLASIWGSHNDIEAAEFLRRFLQGVRYLTPEKREKYNVITKGGMLYWAKWGMDPPLDTTSSLFFKRKHSDTPHLGKDAIAIWVMSKEDKLYTHPAKIHRFHHSSFTSGDLIRCAGDWEVRDGKLMWVSAMSGHYCPTFDHLKNAVQKLSNTFGISLSTFKVKLFKKELNKPKEQVMLKASEFIFNFNDVKNFFMLA